MFVQQSAYILGILNLILAGIAIFCVIQAQDHPEHFSLVYISISIFIFYMGTILIIIILQITKTHQEQHEQNQSSLDRQIPILTTQISSQLNTIIGESSTMPTKSERRLSRSQTCPLTLSSYGSHHISSISTSSSALKNFKNISGGLIATSTPLALLPEYQQTYDTIHKNYQSLACTTNDYRNPLEVSTYR
jgi:hypothetical protein